ncbi:MAG TPA: Crp/Fnr family transcriptional regulator [Pyrinomonadaceae bacterium]|nr:Crp/Fnr family transcriptional regulator [Pyrinomonadaceae bacterium]
MTAALISHVAGRRENIQAISHDTAEKLQSTHHPRHEVVFASQCHHVQRVQLFSGLEQSETTEIAAAACNLRKRRGEFVYMPGDQSDSVYVLRKGRIKLSVLSESGKEIAIDIIQPGEMFGEFALVDESVRSNMTQALDDAAILVFDKHDFVNLLKNQSTLALNYIRMVGDRRRRMEKKLSDITSKEVPARVCELLHELSANTSPAGEVHQNLIPLTHQDVASLIGASRQTTTSVLNDLMRSGYIELGRGWVRIKSLKDIQTYVAVPQK